MGIRKNAKALDATERENFVRACVMMKADIVNPGDPPADQYDRWDEFVAIHRMIQSVNTPGASFVNFGHGGLGAYSFLSWHRYLLLRLELQLQSYVAGVMLPYWDWTDPAPLLTDDFLGPDGDAGTSIVTSGYFAEDAPGTGGNPTPAPAWWPAGLTGWRLHSTFGSFSGPLKREVSSVSGLPTATDMREALDMTSYSSFQNALESGSGLTSSHSMHNGLHPWVGGHMATLTASPFDPWFYMHHCNIDRIWAHWQVDGHATEYPASGGDAEHHRTDIMYPWTGGAAGYSSNHDFTPIAMPDFSALGAQTNEDMLDHRTLGFTYDTLAVVGIALDRTGSMNQMTPDPMIVAAPDVTKWEAAKRGVSAFLLDCESAYASNEAYVTAGVKTFRSLGANDFDAVFAGTPYGLIKTGGGYSSAGFDAAVAGLTASGGTPLADALIDVRDTIVAPPFGWVPADERRYLAMFTDGMLTSGSPLSSITDGSLTNTAIFAMGFGTAADVDYATLDTIVAKGETLSGAQVFHGENAGTIDKFFSDSLAAAIGYTPVVDPAVDLFAGEHSHVDFYATSADESFYITAQGMDFEDAHWSFHLMGPGGQVLYASRKHRGHDGHGGHGCCERCPTVTARRRNGRLTLFVVRDSAHDSCWVGRWSLMVAYKARAMDRMVMLDAGELALPVSAGPARGPRHARLLQPPGKRLSARSIAGPMRHALDVRPTGTSSGTTGACAAVINIYARTRLQLELAVELKNKLTVRVGGSVLQGTVSHLRGVARLVGPTIDVADLVHGRNLPEDVIERSRFKGSKLKYDTGRLLGLLEQRDEKLARVRDEALELVRDKEGMLQTHVEDTETPGLYHVGVYVEGVYEPPAARREENGHGHGAPRRGGQRFTRVLTRTMGRPSPALR